MGFMVRLKQLAFGAAGLLLSAALVCWPHAMFGAVATCPGPAPTPEDSSFSQAESLTQFNTLTAPGLDYVMVSANEGSNFAVTLPGGAVIVQAYMWIVENEGPGSPPPVPNTNATFAGAGVASSETVSNLLWGTLVPCCSNLLYYTDCRFDVTAQVTAAGTSYPWTFTDPPGSVIAATAYLCIVYQLATDTSETTIVFADGMNVWHAEETIEDGPGPEPVGLDWSCTGNAVCNPNGVKITRAGGNEYNVNDAGDGTGGKYSDEIMNYTNQSVLWQGPSGQLPACGAEPCPQVSSYFPGSPAFTIGQTQTMYDMNNNINVGAKDTMWLNALVLMNKCLPACGTPPTLVSSANLANGEVTADTMTVAYNSPGGTNPLLLVHIEDGTNLLPTSVKYGGVP